jgi:hypothetical protein
LGSVLSFTTPPASSIAPTTKSGPTATSAAPVVTKAASAIAADAAVLNATANPSGTATTGWFRYDTSDPGTCNDTFGTRAPTTEGRALGAGANPVAYAQALTGLLPATTYYYCAIAAGQAKPNFGAVLTLTTKAGPPSVQTTPPTEVASDSAVLNGSVIAGGDATLGWFRYSSLNPGSCNDSFGVRAAASEGQKLGAGVTAVTYSMAIAGLTPGTTYYYCAIASNSLGTSFGALVTMVPGTHGTTVITEAASAIDRTGATIAGTVDANGAAAAVWFRYGTFDPGVCDDSFGSRVAAAVDNPLGVETSSGPFTAPLTGLKPNVTYYYCAAASDQGGGKFGLVRSFTTPAAETVTPPVDAVDPQNLGGCTYGARSGSDGSIFWLVSMLPLVGLLMFRRRRRWA